jgi:hypothetical protein
MVDLAPKERARRNPYSWLGLGLAVAGAISSPVFYFVVGSVPLTAMGISFIMLGLTSAALANTRPPLSPEAGQMMFQAGTENTAALLEELGLNGRAVYLPRSLRDGRSQAVVPLRPDQMREPFNRQVAGGLIVRHGSDPLDMGIAVTTPGSICLDALEVTPGPDPGEIETTLTHILVGMLDIASAVSVAAADGVVKVEVSRPKLTYENLWYYRALGSPMASIAATVTCEAYDRPVTVVRDESQRGKGVIELEVLP